MDADTILREKQEEVARETYQGMLDVKRQEDGELEEDEEE